MANFTKEDLVYKDYKHTARPGDDPRLTGKPDSTLLNRSESYEMVYFINRYMTSKSWKQKVTFNKIEKFLRQSTHGHQSHAFWKSDLDKNFKLN